MAKRFISVVCLLCFIITLFVPCVVYASDGVTITAERRLFKNAAVYADILYECEADLHGFSDYLALAKTLSPPSGSNDLFYYPELNLVIMGKSNVESCVNNYNLAYPDTPISYPSVYGNYGEASYQQAYFMPIVFSDPKESDNPGQRIYTVYNIEKYYPSVPDSSDSVSLVDVVDGDTLIYVFREILDTLPVLLTALFGFIAFRKALFWFGGVLKGM